VARSRRRSDEDADLGTSRWWTVGDEQVAAALWGWIDRLKRHHRVQSAMDAVWEAVYRDVPITVARDGSALVRRAQQDSRIKLAKSMVGTMTSRISKRRPMPCISADNAGLAEKRYAKRASRVLRRKMGQSIVERLSPKVVRDGLIRGTGVAKVYRDGGDVAIERIPRRELIIDPSEARYGTPRVMGQVKRISRDVLAAMFPDHREAIMAASAATREEWEPFEGDLDTDQVEVAEGWHLPSGPSAKDGKHVICLRGTLLDCGPWDRQRFQTATFHWCPPVDGFWGTGLVEEAAPTQKEVNDTLAGMGENISAALALKVFTFRGANGMNVNKHHLKAKGPAVVEVDGQMPQYVAPTPFNQPTLEYLKWRIAQAYEMCGISQASAASKSPLGSNVSGKALDTMYDLESDRFADVENEYAQFRVELGQLMLDEARAIAKDYAAGALGDDENGNPIKPAPWIEEIDWQKFDTDAGNYQLILEPVNFLPDSRSGKLAQVREMADAGLLSNPMQTAALFDEPDIAAANRHLLGPYRRIERWLEDLTNVDVALEECVPTPYMLRIPGLAKEMLLGELDMLEAESSGSLEDEKVLERFRWACDMLKGAEEELAQQEAAKAMPAAPAPGATPPVDPMAAMAPPAMPMDPMMLPPVPGNGMGGLDAMAAAGMPLEQGII
jgi:hypothetical protein